MMLLPFCNDKWLVTVGFVQLLFDISQGRMNVAREQRKRLCKSLCNKQKGSLCSCLEEHLLSNSRQGTGSSRQQQDVAGHPQLSHLQQQLKPRVGRDHMEALFSIPLAHELEPLPRNRSQLRNPKVSLSACVHSCLPSLSSPKTRKRPMEHEVQLNCLMSYQYYSPHKNNRNFVKGICFLLLIACPSLWPVCIG